jgi:hypothetical protein
MPLNDAEKALFALARDHIATERLPGTVPISVWAGRGTNGTCSLCALIIAPEQYEYELGGTAD